MIIKSDDYWTITGDATPDTISIVVQEEDDPEVSFKWELSRQCAKELIESLQVMVMPDEYFERIKEVKAKNGQGRTDLSVAMLWQEYLETIDPPVEEEYEGL